MIVHSNLQIIKDRERKYDTLLRKPYLERSEADHFLCYYLLRNIETMVYFCMGIELLPYQGVILRTLLRKTYPLLVLARGGGKTFILGLYAGLRALISHGSKVIIVGSNRRQALFVFSELSKIYYSKRASLFRECCPKSPNFQPEESYLIVKSSDKESKISAFPLAQSEKIRGARASHLLVDEANIVPEDVFNTVLKPMGSVTINPVERVKSLQREKELIDAGVISSSDAIQEDSNQVVLSSSAGYQFQFLYRQYQEYRNQILLSVEQKKRCPYSIIQIGYEAINSVSPGYLDQNNIENAKLTFSKDRFDTEYGAQFVSDSAGFFPSSLLERQTIKIGERPSIEVFPDKGHVYFMAVDPSSAESEKNDYFGIAIGKYDVAKKIVTLVNANGTTGEGWTHHVNLVREYIRTFKPAYITMDKFGGGSNLASLLQAEEYMQKDKGDSMIYQLENDDLSTYNFSDNRILRMIVFRTEWIEQANIHLKSMLDHGRFWFCSPPLNEAYIGTKEIADKYDIADDAVRECKSELSLIVGEQNDKGMTVFKMPESLGAIKKKNRVRKDMYTVCLLMAWAVKEYEDIQAGIQQVTRTYQPVFKLV